MPDGAEGYGEKNTTKIRTGKSWWGNRWEEEVSLRQGLWSEA